MADVLVDTDVFIDHLRGHRAIDRGEDRVFYSVVTRAELFAGRGAEERQVRTLLAPYAELEIDRPIAERAGQVRRTSGISVPDAIIAATALERDLIVVTRNAADFKRVEGLRTKAPK
jgi:predicted nucleic acid-binding protein